MSVNKDKPDLRILIPDYVEKIDKEIDEEIDILVHTDSGNDVDDEPAAGFIVRHSIANLPNSNIRLTFSVKTMKAGVDRLLAYGIKPFTGYDLNPEFNFENVIPLDISGKTLTIIFRDGTTLLPSDYFPHYILNIAPGLDSVLTVSNLVNLRGFSHQGLPGSWSGFNDNGSTAIVSSMLAMQVPSMITTPFESFEVLFGLHTFTEYQIPVGIWDLIARDAFKMIMGRMPPTVPVSVLPMAEGLVNIRYAESIGKPGTNSRLALSIRSQFTGTVQEIHPDLRDWIHRACVVYVDNLIEAALSKGATVSPIKHYEETIESIFQMTIALAEMGMPYLDDSGIRLIYSSDGDLAAKYPEAFEEFKRIGIFTPAYDLVAARKLIGLLQTDGVF